MTGPDDALKPRATTRRLVGLARAVVLVFLSLAAPSHAAIRPEAAAHPQPPVVMIVFDEFSTTSLLDARGHIDAVRYPNFASLAGDSTWFPNDTAPVDETGRAVETILTGRLPRRKLPVTFKENRRNLFTLLGGRYRMDASEEVTSICPKRLCPNVRFRGRRQVLHELAGGRPQRFEAWVRSIRPSRRPTLYFKHLLLPHVPLRYLPSGRRYASGAHEVVPGIVEEFRDPWLIEQAYQRHLLQVGFTDRLLGSALRRLRQQGLYDKALIVVTADNGESFGRTGDRHVITRTNPGDIAITPLFIKLPSERRGRVIRHHVRTVDILPTIAHLLRIRIPWRIQGHSAFGPAARHIPSAVRLVERSGSRVALSFAAFRRRARVSLRRKFRLFGSGNRRPGLYGIGPYPALNGRPASVFTAARRRGRVRAIVHGRAALVSVRPRSSFIPTQITGRLLGHGASRNRNLAVAVNGLIAATGLSFRVPRTHREAFSVLVPEEAFRAGRNEVEIFSIARRGDGVLLERLGTSGG
jgi:hypothetical protein